MKDLGWRATLLLLALAPWGGCVSPNYGAAPFACQQSGRCPEGYRCLEGVCRLTAPGADATVPLDGPRADRPRLDGLAGDGPAPPTCVTLGSWQGTAPFTSSGHLSHPLPAFASGAYFFVHTIRESDGEERILYSARQQGDGSLGAWQVAMADHTGGINGYTAIDVAGVPYHFRNGHIGRYVVDGSGRVAVIALDEESMDSSFGGHRYQWDSAVFVTFSTGARQLYHLGGYSFTTSVYERGIFRSPVPVEPKFTSTGQLHPASNPASPGKAAAFTPPGQSHAFIYTGEASGSRLWRAKVYPDGKMESFVRLDDLPAGTGQQRGDMFVRESTLFVIRGTKVWRTQIAADGALSAWLTAPDLPEDPTAGAASDMPLEGSSSGIIDDHVYVTGPMKVYHARFEATGACPP